MSKKPDTSVINAERARKANPNFGKDVLTALINETPELRDELLRRGLVKEVPNA